MGGAVSSGRDNNELIDNLMSGNYIRTRRVEKVFRALDRADYMTPEARDQAYKDLAWRNGVLHLSSPCIYSEVMEGLELKPGLSFLNIGSGTGYLSTLVGLILGTSGISHGVEVQPTTVEYSVMKQRQFIENSATLDDFDFCEPKFFIGNGLTLAPLQCGYDRVYCGAGCPEEYESYFKNLIKVGGILVLPINDTLQQVKRISEDEWVSRNLLNVSFATLRVPARDEAIDQIKLAELVPPRLQLLARARIRAAMREGVMRRNPELKEKPWRRPPRHNCPRRICIPIEPGGDVQNLNVLHDLDTESGANEMNALLSLVISMGQNRVAGALRFDRVARRGSDDSGTSQHGDDNDSSQDDDDSDGSDDTIDINSNAETDEKAIEGGDEDKGATDHHDELDKSGKEAKPKTDTTKDTDKPDKKEKEDSKNKEEDDDNETDSQSDSSTVGGLRAKIKQLKARRDRRIAKLKRLSKKLSREIGIGKPSTSKDEGKKNTRKDNDKAKTKKSVTSDDDEADDNSGDDDDDKPGGSGGSGGTVDGIPSEVEIFIPKLQEPGTSAEMDWQDSRATVIGNGGEVCKSKAKRQKLDSGIGENSPSGSLDKSEDSEESVTDDDSDNWEDIDTESMSVGGRRRRSGASTLSPDAGGPAGDAGGAEGAGGAEDAAERSLAREEARRLARRRRAAARGGDARRARLSLLMKRAVRELPLPQPLKKFVNLGRCYEF